MTHKIRIVLVDDHLRVHQGIRAAIDAFDDMELVGDASNGLEAIDLCAQLQPDVVLMDVLMPGMGGIEATRIIHQQLPHIKLIAISSYQDETAVRQMLAAGTNGYLLKNSSIDDLADTIRNVYAGKFIFSAEVAQSLLNTPTDAEASPTTRYDLTARELEILRLIVGGLSNSEIAAALTISVSTAKFHVSNVIAKLGVTNRVEAVALAMAQKLI